MPQAIDTTAYVGTTSKQAADYWDKSTNQYNWAKDQFAKNQGVSDQVVNRALDTGKQFSDYATGDRSFWDTSYKPAMQQQLDYAKEYTSPERMAANRGQAIAGVSTAFDANRAAAERTLGGYNIDPSSGRFAGLDAGLAAKRAMAAAGAGTKSDRDTEMMGQQLLDNAIKTGSVLPGQAANEAGVSLAAGNAAANTGLATTASGAATMGTPIQWAGLGDDMIKEWMGSELKSGQLDLDQQKLAQGSSSGIGALIGAGAGILGSIAGGPVGGMIGSQLGNMVGSAATGGGGFGASLSSGMFRRGGSVQRMEDGGPVEGEEDMTDQFNTELTPEEQQEYEQWIQRNSARSRGYAEGGRVDSLDGAVASIWGPDAVEQPRAFAEGGMAGDDMMVDTPEQEMAEGEGGPGAVPPEASPSGGQQTDDVHALLNEGEFVIPKPVTNWYGEKFMQKLIQKAYDEMETMRGAQGEPASPSQEQAVASSAPTFQTAGA